jgi:hypothetical protein
MRLEIRAIETGDGKCFYKMKLGGFTGSPPRGKVRCSVTIEKDTQLEDLIEEAAEKMNKRIQELGLQSKFPLLPVTIQEG